MSSRNSILRFTPPRDEPQLAREERRAKGVYYTPPEIVRWIVRRAVEVLKPVLKTPLRVLDPACGAGAFLQDARAQIPGCTLVGVDIDPNAIATTRELVTHHSLLNHNPNLNPNPLLPLSPRVDLLCGDFLSSSFSPKLFDLILGNPPYVNIRELAKSTSPAYRRQLRERYRTARGNFDLYPLFLERSLALLRPGGVCGMIIPNKWAGLDYALPLREILLAETTLHDIVDLSELSVFAAAEVYPHVAVWQRQPPPKNHAVRVQVVASVGELQGNRRPARFLPQAHLSPRTISLHLMLDVESRVPTQPLGQRAKLHSGASGYTAERLMKLLREAKRAGSAKRRGADFIVSGNIDRFAIRLGNVRFMKRQFRRPVLDLAAEELSALKMRLYRSPKIVIAGMSRRIEAAYDERGLALGVQVYAAVETLDDPYYLLALLNSRLMSFLFRERFAAKKLAGGYLAMNKGQLEQLPIRVVKKGEEEIAARLAELAALRNHPEASAKESVAQEKAVSFACASGWCEIDRQIDQLVYQLYLLTAAEIRQVDAAFEERRAKAA